MSWFRLFLLMLLITANALVPRAWATGGGRQFTLRQGTLSYGMAQPNPLAIYLPLAGNFDDASGNNLTVNPLGGIGFAAAPWGTAASCDGVDDRVELPADPVFQNLTEYTYTACMYPRGWGQAGFGRIISVNNPTNTNTEIVYALDQTGAFVRAIEGRWDVTNGQWVTANGTIVLNTAYHVAWTYRQATNATQHYINGASVQTTEEQAPAGTFFPGTGNLSVCNSGFGGRAFSGEMGHVRVYRTVLTEPEITAIMAADCPPAVPSNGLEATATLTAYPETIIAGESAELRWETMNASSCTASGGWTGSKTATGGIIHTETVSPSSTTVYSLSCVGPAGRAWIENQTVTVQPTTVHYVDTNSTGGTCNDSNAGTSISAPWCTLGKAVSTLTAGQTAYVRAGTYTESGLLPANSGTAGNYIIFAAFPGEAPIIDGTGSNVWNLANRNYITVRGFAIQNPSTAGVYLQNSNFNRILDNTITGELNFSQDGIRLFGDSSDNRIIKNTIKTTDTPGLPSVTCETVSQDCNAFFDGITLKLGNNNRNLIQENMVGRVMHIAMQVFDSSPGSTGNIIRLNEFRNIWHSNSVGAFNNTDYLIERNKIFDAGEDKDNNPFRFEANKARPSHASAQFDTAFAGVYRRNELNDNGRQQFMENTNGMVIYHIVAFQEEGQTFFADFKIPSEPNFNNRVLNSIWEDGQYTGAGRCFQIGGNTTPADNFMFTNNFVTCEIWIGGSGGSVQTVAQLQAAYPVNWINNTQDVPTLFVDPVNEDYRLQAGSQMIDSGQFLTTTTNMGTNQTTLTLANARFFHAGSGQIKGDIVQTAGGQAARVVTVDYGTNTITVDRPMTWMTGEGISQPYTGSAPDKGAHEYHP